ncbi:MAG TPA: hypothetical protein VGP13_01730 [Candidatus Paceibacterota bacterium]|jgi:hypothetical protein|nr:hypothetical protein [Candidatus Paceibacterota bacterium]
MKTAVLAIFLAAVSICSARADSVNFDAMEAVCAGKKPAISSLLCSKIVLEARVALLRANTLAILVRRAKETGVAQMLVRLEPDAAIAMQDSEDFLRSIKRDHRDAWAVRN